MAIKLFGTTGSIRLFSDAERQQWISDEEKKRKKREAEELQQQKKQRFEQVTKQAEEAQKEAAIPLWRRTLSKEALFGAAKKLVTQPKQALKVAGEEAKPLVARGLKYVTEKGLAPMTAGVAGEKPSIYSKSGKLIKKGTTGITPEVLEKRRAEKKSVPRRMAGGALELAMFKGGGGAAKAGIKKVTEPIVKRLGKSALEFGGYGAGFGVAEEIQAEKPSVLEGAKKVGMYGITGAVAGPIVTGTGIVLKGILKNIFGKAKIAKVAPKEAISVTKRATQKAESVADFIQKNPNLEVKTTKTLGKDLNNKVINSRLEWDYNTGKGTIFVTPKTTEGDLAHEIGHFLDKSITAEDRQILLAEGEKIVGKHITPNETFARAVAEVIKNPDKTKAPAITSYLHGQGLIFEKPGIVPKLAEAPAVKPGKGKLPAELSEAEANVARYKDLQKEIINTEAQTLKDMEASATAGITAKEAEVGGGMEYRRFTEHGQAYRDYYKQYGRKPGLNFWKQEAKKDLEMGKGAYVKDYQEAQRLIDEAAAKVKGERAVTRAQLGGVKEAIQPKEAPIPAKPGQVVFKPSGKITGAGVKPLAFKPTKTPSYNPAKINAPEDIENLISMTSKDFAKQRRGVISNEQLKDLSFMTGVSQNELMAAKPGSIANAETALASRQIMLDQATQLSEYARSITGRATPDQLRMFKKMLGDFNATQKTVAGFRTEAGRLFQQFGMEVKPGENATLNEMIKQVARIDKGAAEAIDKVGNLNKIVQPTNLSNMVGLWKAGLLTSPITHFKNIIGNSAMVALRTISDFPAAAADVTQSVFTKKRTKTIGGIGARISGMWEGTKEMPGVMKEALTRGGISTKADVLREVRYKNKVIDYTFGNYARGIFGALNAADRPFYHSALKASLSDQARVISKNTGQAVKTILANPTDDMIKIATADAEYAVFRGTNFLSQAAAGVKKPIGAVGEVIAPFTRTPSGVAMTMIDYSPVGLPVEIVRQLATKTYNQRALSEALGKAVAGTGVLYAGFKLAERGLMTGTIPDSKSKRNLWQIEGKQAYSILINNKWVPLSSIQPFGNMLGVGAEMYNAAKKGGNAKMAVSFLATVGKSMVEQSFMQGISRTLDAVNNPEQYAGKWFESLVTGLVPSVVGAIARGTDKYVREVEGLKPALKAKIPTLGKQLPAKTDIFLKPIERQSSALNEMFNFIKGRKAVSDTITKEFERLMETDNTPALTNIDDRDKIQEFKKQVGDEKYNQFVNEYGPKLRDEYQATIMDVRYLDLSDKDKKSKLDSVKNNLVNDLLWQYGYIKPETSRRPW